MPVASSAGNVMIAAPPASVEIAPPAMPAKNRKAMWRKSIQWLVEASDCRAPIQLASHRRSDGSHNEAGPETQLRARNSWLPIPGAMAEMAPSPLQVQAQPSDDRAVPETRRVGARVPRTVSRPKSTYSASALTVTCGFEMKCSMPPPAVQPTRVSSERTEESDYPQIATRFPRRRSPRRPWQRRACAVPATAGPQARLWRATTAWSCGNAKQAVVGKVLIDSLPLTQFASASTPYTKFCDCQL